MVDLVIKNDHCGDKKIITVVIKACTAEMCVCLRPAWLPWSSLAAITDAGMVELMRKAPTAQVCRRVQDWTGLLLTRCFFTCVCSPHQPRMRDFFSLDVDFPIVSPARNFVHMCALFQCELCFHMCFVCACDLFAYVPSVHVCFVYRCVLISCVLWLCVCFFLYVCFVCMYASFVCVHCLLSALSNMCVCHACLCAYFICVLSSRMSFLLCVCLARTNAFFMCVYFVLLLLSYPTCARLHAAFDTRDMQACVALIAWK